MVDILRYFGIFDGYFRQHTGRKVLWQTAKNMEYISVGGVVLEPEASRLKLEEILSHVLATTDTDLVYEVRTAATSSASLG